MLSLKILEVSLVYIVQNESLPSLHYSNTPLLVYFLPITKMVLSCSTLVTRSLRAIAMAEIRMLMVCVFAVVQRGAAIAAIDHTVLELQKS